MDRTDVRFAAQALEARLAADLNELDRLASSCVVRLMAVAQALRRNAGAWAPALLGATRLEAIARGGALAADLPAHDDEKIIVDKLLAHAAERPTPPNRHERRTRAKLILPRNQRLIGGRKLVSVH